MDIRDPYRLGIPQGRRPVASLLGGVQVDDTFLPTKTTGIYDPRPIVPSAASQYMIAQEKARRALDESTRMQQGQIPQIKMPEPKRPQDVLADQARRQQSQLNLPQRPEQEEGFLQKLYADPSSARGKALQAAAATALQLSGYQDKPITTGEVLGAMMQSGMGAYEKAQASEQAKELAAQQRATDLQLKLMEIEAARGGKTFGQEKDLRKEFVTASKEFEEALNGYEKVQQAAMTKDPSGATDIALIFGYMKVLDPRSVVREGEFATAENAGGVAANIRNLYNKLRTGQRLDAKVRLQFVDAARNQFAPQLERQVAREQTFSDLSTSYGLDASKVVQTKLPKMGSLSRPETAQSVEEAQEKFPKGTYVMIDGRLGIVN